MKKKKNWLLDHDGGSKEDDGVPAKSFYPIFEDLLVMASGRCTTYGVGDYGLFAARLTGNMYFCSWNHQYESGILPATAKSMELPTTIRSTRSDRYTLLHIYSLCVYI